MYIFIITFPETWLFPEVTLLKNGKEGAVLKLNPNSSTSFKEELYMISPWTEIYLCGC